MSDEILVTASSGNTIFKKECARIVWSKKMVKVKCIFGRIELFQGQK